MYHIFPLKEQRKEVLDRHPNLIAPVAGEPYLSDDTVPDSLMTDREWRMWIWSIVKKLGRYRVHETRKGRKNLSKALWEGDIEGPW